jgi:hypothetical protein
MKKYINYLMYLKRKSEERVGCVQTVRSTEKRQPKLPF